MQFTNLKANKYECTMDQVKVKVKGKGTVSR